MPYKIRQISIISGMGALLILLIANVLVCLSDMRRESKILDAPASWWLAKTYFSEPTPSDIVIFGSSQLGPLLSADAYVFNRAVDITGDHLHMFLNMILRDF